MAGSTLIETPTPVTQANPPGAEIGAVTQQIGGINGWGSFVDEQEYVPELQWPQSVRTYHRMRSDSQNEALHLGTVQPVREFRWSIDPNGAPAAMVEQVASDFGLPIKGKEDDPIAISPAEFQWDAFLDDALLAPLYGHFYFEIVGDVQGSAWHMLKLSPRHPRTIAMFQADVVGELLGIRQNIGPAAGWMRMPPPIPAGKLVPFVWRPEAGSHVGRSMLRSLYREWMVKDRTLRVAAISLERGSGVPVIEGPAGASDKQIADLAVMARQFKIAEGGGGAIPFGSKLTLVGGNVPSAVSLLEYCDQAMARVWALMLVQLGLGASSSGNRALGGEFALYAARAQRLMAKWVCSRTNRFLESYAKWNAGEDVKRAPLLHFEQDKPDALSVAELVALIEAEALTVDPELESWIRNEYGVPAYTPPNGGQELGDLSPQEVELVQNSRNPPQLPAPPTPGAPTPQDAAQDVNVVNAAADPLSAPQLALPARTLRRQPNAHEIAARVDFRALDATYSSTADSLVDAFLQQIIPAQITALGSQITTTQAGTERKVLTKAAMTSLRAPLTGGDLLDAHLLEAAKAGAQSAAAELAAQGGSATIPDESALTAAVADQSNAVVTMAANGISLSAQRKAQSLVGGGRTPADIKTEVEGYLSGLKQNWTARELRGAVNFAQNVGRTLTFASADQSKITYYASEILDVNTCDECTTVDGTEYQSLADATQDYSAGGYVDCAGGPNCRGTLVAVYTEADPSGGTQQLAADFA